jgi:hypothetical protein
MAVNVRVKDLIPAPPPAHRGTIVGRKELAALSSASSWQLAARRRYDTDPLRAESRELRAASC